MENISWLVYRAVSFESWGIKMVKNGLILRQIGETFIQSSMNIITLPKTISHIAGECINLIWRI